MDETVRLSKRIARSGKYSRHEADKLISQGRVKFNGEVATPGYHVPQSGGIIEIDSVALLSVDANVYKFHKPVNVLSSYYDPNGKRNLSSFKSLDGLRLGYSGRLDYNSEGLMIFTSDGDLIYKLQRSEFGIEKEYFVNTDCDITDDWISKLQNGIADKTDIFLPCRVIRNSPKNYTVILTEGKKRQVRRMFKAAGATVLLLRRVRIGSILLDELKEGELKPLSQIELENLFACIKSGGKENNL